MDETNIRLKILASFLKFLSEDQKKKRFLSQNFNEIRCKSTKITKIRAVNTNLGVLGLNLHFNSPEPVNLFGAQSSIGGGHNFRLGGHKQLFGGHGLGMPPVAPGLARVYVFGLGPELVGPFTTLRQRRSTTCYHCFYLFNRAWSLRAQY